MKLLEIFRKPVLNDEFTFGEFYSIDVCPECLVELDQVKARYKSKCCYVCGHSNGSLFYTKNVIVRDRFLNGKYLDTILKESK